MLARRDPLYQPLADRVSGVLFLGTPHRGADSAKLLNNILRLSFAHKPKSYVEDLKRGSGATQAINDEFRHYSNQLRLRSFYETLKTQHGLFSRLIVSKDSAILGYPNEQSSLLNSDHPGLCKFNESSDPNFGLVRNALVSLLHEVTTAQASRTSSDSRDQNPEMPEILNIQDRSDVHLVGPQPKGTEKNCSTGTRRSEAWHAGESSQANENNQANFLTPHAT